MSRKKNVHERGLDPDGHYDVKLIGDPKSRFNIELRWNQFNSGSPVSRSSWAGRSAWYTERKTWPKIARLASPCSTLNAGRH